MIANNKAAYLNTVPLTALDFFDRELKIGDKVAYATANMEGTADLHSAWIAGFRIVTSSMYGGNYKYIVADMSTVSPKSTKIDAYQNADSLIFVESPDSE